MLDVACGSGRVLLPLLSAGVDVDGCDISQDMLDQCLANAHKLGLTPTLYAQPMDTFEIPRRYRTIYICDSFGLAGSRERDLDTLRRCYEHLEEGGALVVNLEAEYNSPDAWRRWLPSGARRCQRNGALIRQLGWLLTAPSIAPTSAWSTSTRSPRRTPAKSD